MAKNKTKELPQGARREVIGFRTSALTEEAYQILNGLRGEELARFLNELVETYNNSRSIQVKQDEAIHQLQKRIDQLQATVEDGFSRFNKVLSGNVQWTPSPQFEEEEQGEEQDLHLRVVSSDSFTQLDPDERSDYDF